MWAGADGWLEDEPPPEEFPPDAFPPEPEDEPPLLGWLSGVLPASEELQKKSYLRQKSLL